MDPSRRHHLQAAALLLGAAALPHALAQPRPLMQAMPWRPVRDLADWWVSEKLDGMRGFWDGRALWTRSGKAIHAPPWFTAGWPPHPMDGELWAGRGQFETTVSTVRRRQPVDAAWRAIRFMVFDMPARQEHFSHRLHLLAEVTGQALVPWLQPVPHERATSEAALQQRLSQVVAQGGEGLMLHHGQALYQGTRSGSLLKLKPQDDAEARVIAHLPGSGALAGQLGALLVEMPANSAHSPRRFRLGTGLSATDRISPPPVGAWVSFRYQGLTDAGVPRFASYWRQRPEE